MSIRLRDNLQNLAEVPTPRTGWRARLGLADPDGADQDRVREAVDLCLTGMRWAALANLVAMAAIAAILFNLDTAIDSTVLIQLAGAGAVILASDLISLIPAVRQRLTQRADNGTIAILTLLNTISAVSWSVAFMAAPTLGGQMALVGTNALTLAKLATLAIPIVLGARLFASLGVYALAGLGTLATVIAGVTTILTIAMAMAIAARRKNLRHEQSSSSGRDRVARDLLNGFERSGRGWFWQTNARGRLTYISDELAARLDTRAADLIGTHFAALVKSSDAGELAASQGDQTIEFALAAGIEFNDLIVLAQTEEERWWSLSGMPILDGHGRCIGFHGSGTDLSEQRKSEADANRLANYDGLTGLPNRVNMRRTLEELMDSNSLRQGGCGLLLLDLDRFKNVNDTLGHPMGDALLKVVAQRLSRVIGSKGQVGRLGGDEFKVIVPDVQDRAGLAELAEAIISRLSLPYVIDDCSIQIGATVGIAIAPTDGGDADELTRNADLALYAAKAAGKGVHRFYQPEMHADANERRAIENDLREVLARGELSVLYQPVVDAESEQVVSFEALIRWDHPQRGAVSPALFIPIAEEIGMIGRIGDWVIRTACREAASWPDHLRVAVNLSPIQFASPSLVGTLVSALADSGLTPGRLELEVTEGVLLNADPVIDRTIASIGAMGIGLSLDDFGTGYSSLSYLQRVPFRKIKIDRSFVRGAAEVQDRNSAIIRAIVGLAESLGMDTVAEGAETLDDLAQIRALGCSQIQGYIFGFPLTADEARARAAASRPETNDDERSWHEREARVGLLRVAELRSVGKKYDVMVRNISAHGALVEARGDAAIGQSVELHLGDGWKFTGEVRWRRDKRFGIAFARPIAVQDFVMGHHAPIEDDGDATDFDAIDAAVDAVPGQPAEETCGDALDTVSAETAPDPALETASGDSEADAADDVSDDVADDDGVADENAEPDDSDAAAADSTDVDETDADDTGVDDADVDDADDVEPLRRRA